jgi:HEAT repeat protein
VAEALVWLDAVDDEVVAVLGQLLRENNEDIRYESSSSILSLRVSATAILPDLLDGLQSDNSIVRCRCAEAISRIGPDAKQAVPNLVKALNDPDWRVRLRVVVALSNIGAAAQPALPSLEKTQQADSHAEVRDLAREAIRRIRTGGK